MGTERLFQVILLLEVFFSGAAVCVVLLKSFGSSKVQETLRRINSRFTFDNFATREEKHAQKRHVLHS